MDTLFTVKVKISLLLLMPNLHMFCFIFSCWSFVYFCLICHSGAIRIASFPFVLNIYRVGQKSKPLYWSSRHILRFTLARLFDTAFSTFYVTFIKINTKTLQFNKYCKGLPVKALKQQKSFWGWHSICERLQLPLQDELSWSSVGYSLL